MSWLRRLPKSVEVFDRLERFTTLSEALRYLDETFGRGDDDAELVKVHNALKAAAASNNPAVLLEAFEALKGFLAERQKLRLPARRARPVVPMRSRYTDE